MTVLDFMLMRLERARLHLIGAVGAARCRDGGSGWSLMRRAGRGVVAGAVGGCWSVVMTHKN